VRRWSPPRRIAFGLVGSFVALSLVAGCSSNPKGPERSTKAVESFRETQKNLAAASAQVQETNASLRQLTAAGAGGDLRPVFNKFAEDVRQTQDLAKKAGERAAAMRAKTDVYVTQWNAEIQGISDEQLRAQGQQRMAAARADFGRVAGVAQEARAAYEPYMTGLQDIQTYLSNDLTAGGVASVQSKAQSTIRAGESLRQKLDALQQELEQVASKWSSRIAG
jgi:hypothetical protein